MNAETQTTEPTDVESPENPALDAVDGEATTETDWAAEATKFRDLYLRAQADLDNFRKRTAREKEESVRYANASLLERLLPVMDNFELGLDAASKANDAAGILQGMSMVRRQMQDFLADSGVDAIVAEGAPFDPNLHEAVGQEASDTMPEGHVLRQLRKGFKLRDRLLRPATVIVSKGAGAKAETTPDEPAGA